MEEGMSVDRQTKNSKYEEVAANDRDVSRTVSAGSRSTFDAVVVEMVW